MKHKPTIKLYDFTQMSEFDKECETPVKLEDYRPRAHLENNVITIDFKKEK